tara:strand:+ start:222 stop:779 length:558 start_codon:yes stop_codon:yes gene_type:complete
MPINFLKIHDNFHMQWDVEKIVNELSNIRSSLEPEDPMGISFNRNLYTLYKYECESLADNLTNIQTTIKQSCLPTKSVMLDAFLGCAFSPKRICISRLLPGQAVAVHCDKTRSIALNIGIKNANACKIHMSNTVDINKFWESERQEYVMNDGDMYLVHVKNAHLVESLRPISDRITRFIITYSLI